MGKRGGGWKGEGKEKLKGRGLDGSQEERLLAARVEGRSWEKREKRGAAKMPL